MPTYDLIKTAPNLGSSLPLRWLPTIETIKYVKCWLSMAKLG